MGKNKPYDALLQGSNRNYGTGISTDIRQAELEQPIYVKPNLIAENGKPFQGNLEYFFTLYC